MFRKTVSGIMLILLLIGVLIWAFDIKPVIASGTIYIRADGSVDPPTAPIQRDGDLYTLTGNITSDSDGIVIERNNMTLNGAGYTIQADGRAHAGLYSFGCNNLTLRDLRTSGFLWGIYIHRSNNSRILNNTIVNPYSVGIEVHHFCYNTVVSGNAVTGGARGIHLSFNEKNLVTDNTIRIAGEAIALGASHLNTIRNNTVEDLIPGIGSMVVSLWSSRNNLVHANNGPIRLRHATNNTVSGNNVTYRAGPGIRLGHSSHNLIVDNNITNNNVYGIWLYINNTFNIISENNVSYNSGDGIMLYRALISPPPPPPLSNNNNTISGNTLSYNLGNGIILQNSSYNTIYANQVINNGQNGIYIHRFSGHSDHNSVIGNTILNNGYDAIHLIQADNSIISHNTCSRNRRGISMSGCNYATIYQNIVANNSEYGIRIAKESYRGGTHNMVFENTINDNACGVELFGYGGDPPESFNRLYHNNFINNSCQAQTFDSSKNAWDNGYPSGGNYWSDYIDADLYSGPYQNETGSDGIWDHPYVIGENNVDGYPFVNVSGWETPTPEQAIHDLIDIVESMNLQQGIDNSLDAKLTVVLHALEALNADQRNDAINKLNAFINEVEAQREKKLTNEQADCLIAKAKEIIDLIKG